MDPQDVPVGPLAVDTDAFSILHLKKDRHADFAPLMSGHELALPFAVVGELKVLPIRSKWGQKNTACLEAAIGQCVILPASIAVVNQWAELYSRFLDRLQRGGINDMWAAACCLVHGIPLMTGNLSDFQRIASEFPALELVHPDL